MMATKKKMNLPSTRAASSDIAPFIVALKISGERRKLELKLEMKENVRWKKHQPHKLNLFSFSFSLTSAS